MSVVVRAPSRDPGWTPCLVYNERSPKDKVPRKGGHFTVDFSMWRTPNPPPPFYYDR